MQGLSDLTGKLGVEFKDLGLLRLALTHPSAGARNNQRLEFLGDAVLQVCMSDLLFRRHGKLHEGELTRLRASLVCEDALYEVASALDLRSQLRSKPPLQADSRGARSALADAVEAVLAAVYLDQGFDAAMALVDRLWQGKLTSGVERENPKSALQERLQTDGGSEPSYQTLFEEGPPHRRLYTVAVFSADRELARGQGGSKKAAEQEAARQALKRLSGAEEADEA